jgi:cell division protein FtsI/penicillin-binding protein 2
LSKWVLLSEKSINWFFILTPNPSRYYPEWNLASQVIWFVDNSWAWNYWIEWYFNDILKWNNGEIISRKDTNWRIIDTISLNEEDLIWEWVQIYLTIDRNIQKKVEEVLEKWVKQYKANKWRVIIMNPKTGDIIAMASYPSFDLNNFWDVYEIEKVNYYEYPNPTTDLLWYPILVEDNEVWTKFIYDNKEIYLREATREELWDMVLVKYKYKNDYWAWVYRNDVISALFEPGSIMKALTVAIWIDTWEITPESTYNDEWSVQIDQFTIKNTDRHCLGYHTFWNALDRSCNVWMVRISQKVWKVLMHQYLEDFWIWILTWIELQWEANAKLEDWEKWSQAGLFTRSYGLWVSLTQLQMASAYNVIANWWIYIKPKIIDKIVYPDGREVVYKPEELRRVIKESTSKTVVDMMYNWTHNGQWLTEGGHVEWYRFALKSWTAQIAYRWQYETWIGSTIGSFAWFWPIEDPQFTMIVTLERPRTNEWWASTSWKIFQEIATYLVDYLEIPKRK